MSGCATGSGGGSGGASDEWPAGRTFLSTSVTEHGADRQLVEGTRISLRFQDDGRVSADAGCNQISGDGRLEGGKLLVKDLMMTEIGCPQDRAQQDRWLIEVLTGSPGLELNGDQLTLTGQDVTIKLTDRRVLDPDRALTGTTWVVDTIIKGEAASSVPQGAEATLRIDPAGTFEAATGCPGGRLTGTAMVAGSQVTFVVTTVTACTGAGNVLDAAVRATLSGQVRYEIEARRLSLTGSGDDGLGLVAQS